MPDNLELVRVTLLALETMALLPKGLVRLWWEGFSFGCSRFSLPIGSWAWGWLRCLCFSLYVCVLRLSNVNHSKLIVPTPFWTILEIRFWVYHLSSWGIHSAVLSEALGNVQGILLISFPYPLCCCYSFVRRKFGSWKRSIRSLQLCRCDSLIDLFD